MFHTIAWGQSIDPAGVLSPLDAIPETQLFSSGDDIRVPAKLPGLIGAAALENDASAARAQLQAPSLRVLTNLDIEPIVAAATFGNPPEVLFHPESLIPLDPDEALQFHVESNPAAPVQHFGLVWLADGPQQVAEGRLFSVRATSAVAQSNTAWVNGTLTLAQSLPAGNYQVVGMRSRSADLVAARLVFTEQTNRPGVPAVNAIGDRDARAFRHGRSGVFGVFPNTIPPTVDVLGGAAVAQVHILDLIRL